ncbi:MAG: AbrB/MazE/SpoVT family DNA-binding domain-containing protein [Thermoleophilia bacterium]|nr:AbrB/MazE/SpoVT family DNA-binding domain-containing protein [Thermoleophilia bacterium]
MSALNSQAVRIPAELAYERNDLDVEIERVGDEIRIRPARRRLDRVLPSFARFSAASARRYRPRRLRFGGRGGTWPHARGKPQQEEGRA